MDREQWALFSQGIIDLRGEITLETAEYVREVITTLKVDKTKEVTVWITSPGGDLRPGLAIYDMLRTFDGQVTGKVIGNAGSMAVVVLQGCHVRTAQKNSTIFVHDPSYTKVAFLALERQIRTRDYGEIKEIKSRLHRILASRSRMSLKEVATLCRRETYLFADHAKKLGLVDKLI